MPVEIDQCVGDWYDLDEADRCYLSAELERNQLGESAFLGEQVWNQQGRFRIRVGPVGLQTFSGLPAPRARHGQTGAVHTVPRRPGHGL